MPNLGQVEKIYQAIVGKTEKNEYDGSFFKDDFSRKYFLNNEISEANIAEAIAYLENPMNANVSLQKEMLTTLRGIKGNLASIQQGTKDSIADLKSKNEGRESLSQDFLAFEKVMKGTTFSVDGVQARVMKINAAGVRTGIIGDVVIEYTPPNGRTYSLTVLFGAYESGKYIPKLGEQFGFIVKNDSSNNTISFIKKEEKSNTPHPAAADGAFIKASPLVRPPETAATVPPGPAPATTPSPQPVPPATPTAPLAAPAKKPRTAEEITSGNKQFITKNRDAIVEAINKISNEEKKVEMMSWIGDPTSENIKKFQKGVDAKADGDFRGETLKVLKEWAGLTDTAPAAVPGAPAGKKEAGKEKPQSKITYPEVFSDEDKKTIEKEFVGLLQFSKIKFEGAPAGTKVEKIEAYKFGDTLGIKIFVSKMIKPIIFPLEEDKSTPDNSMIINYVPYDVETNRETGVIKMKQTLDSETMAKFKEKYPGFFPLSEKIKFTGDLPKDFQNGVKDFFIRPDSFVVYGDNDQGINLALDAGTHTYQEEIHDRRPYTITVNPKDGTIDFKKTVDDDKVTAVFSAFGIKGDEKEIKVTETGNIAAKDKIATTDFHVTSDGKGLDFTDAKIRLNNEQVDGKWVYTRDGREATVSYDKTKQTLTLGDTPRQKFIDTLPKNKNIQIATDRTPKKLLATIQHVNYTQNGYDNMYMEKGDLSLSAKQATVLARYQGIQTTHNMFKDGVQGDKIRLVTNGVDDKGNLIMVHNLNSDTTFQILITPEGDVSAIVRRGGRMEGKLQSVRDALGIITDPIPSQQALINEIKTLIANTPTF